MSTGKELGKKTPHKNGALGSRNGGGTPHPCFSSVVPQAGWGDAETRRVWDGLVVRAEKGAAGAWREAGRQRVWVGERAEKGRADILMGLLLVGLENCK